MRSKRRRDHRAPNADMRIYNDQTADYVRYLMAEEITPHDRILNAAGDTYWPPAIITRGPVHGGGSVVFDVRIPRVGTQPARRMTVKMPAQEWVTVE